MLFHSALQEFMKHAKRPLRYPLPLETLVTLKPVNPELVTQLLALLRERNGFFAFGNALHVFPFGRTDYGYDLETWNRPDTWRSEFGSLIDERLLFFAEDVFGDQFGLLGSKVVRFNSETAELTFIGDSLTAWMDLILSDPNFETGRPAGQTWQAQKRLLLANERLYAITPFVLGGKCTVENLFAIDAVEGMRSKSFIASKIKDLPNGAKIRINFPVPPGKT